MLAPWDMLRYFNNPTGGTFTVGATQIQEIPADPTRVALIIGYGAAQSATGLLEFAPTGNYVFNGSFGLYIYNSPIILTLADVGPLVNQAWTFRSVTGVGLICFWLAMSLNTALPSDGGASGSAASLQSVVDQLAALVQQLGGQSLPQQQQSQSVASCTPPFPPCPSG